METIKGNLILKENTTFNEDLKVEGSIIGDYNLTVLGDINCLNIHCNNIDCNNIDCLDIDCFNIDCFNIDCLDIHCNDINCLDINCNDINYYAVCFAYNNIKCKSIKGRRKNSKHFVLDGEIIIKEEKKCKEWGKLK